MSEDESFPGSGIIIDKDKQKLLSSDKVEDYEVLPTVPDDTEEFVEDVKNAMKKLVKDGKEFVEETKMKFREVYIRWF